MDELHELLPFSETFKTDRQDRQTTIHDCKRQGFFPKKTSMPAFSCTLGCVNGGTCAFGSPDQQWQGEVEVPWETKKNGMHCICPDGFTGLQCEMTFEVCGESQHPCFNGSRCTVQDEKSFCDCTASPESIRDTFAGHYCQHAASELCSSRTSYLDEQNQPRHSFCSNGGSCIKQVGPTEE